MKKSLLVIIIALAIFFYPTTSNSKADGSPGEPEALELEVVG